jgi:hypothetical protein
LEVPTTVTNQNLIQEEIERGLNSGNACYHSIQNLLSSHLLPKKCKNQNVQGYNFAYGFVWVQSWSLTLWEEHRLRIFENRVLRRIFGPKKNEVMGRRRKLHN